MVKTYEEVAEQIYDDLQHNRITTYKEYKERLDKEKGGAVINEILHNRWSFGFCDLCGTYINYDDDVWYDVCMSEPEEQDVLEETLPVYQKKVGHEIQDVCIECWHKLLKEK